MTDDIVKLVLRVNGNLLATIDISDLDMSRPEHRLYINEEITHHLRLRKGAPSCPPKRPTTP